jgi:hypothetical protein
VTLPGVGASFHARLSIATISRDDFSHSALAISLAASSQPFLQAQEAPMPLSLLLVIFFSIALFVG